MTDDIPTKFTHIGIEKRTQKQIAILAKVMGSHMYDLVKAWADDAWEEALVAGLVNTSMLEPTAEKAVAG